MIKRQSKISVIGAGNVGATIAYTIAMKTLVAELMIIDVNKEKAEGEAMDIREGLSIPGEMNVRAGDFSDVKDSDIIIVSAGVGRKPGETRLDLAQKNVNVIETITRNIMEHYNTGVIMVVSNPVDVNTYIVQKVSGLPKGRVFGTGTSLDSARFRYILSEKVGVDVKNVHGFIAGEHGETQFPVWSSVHVSGMEFDHYCKENGIDVDKDEIEKEVKNSGAEVIKRKGATYYAISSVVLGLCQAILKNQKTIYPTSTLLDGIFGINDVCLSLPSIVGINGAEKTIKFSFVDEELEKLKYSAEQVGEIIEKLKYETKEER